MGILNSERLLITSPNALREVLNTRSYEFVKPAQVVSGLSRILGIGVLLAEGDEHKRQRRNLMPAFSFRHVKDLYPGFWAKSVEVLEAMTVQVQAGGIQHDDLPDKHKEALKSNPSPSSTVVEVSDWASRATLDIISVAGMGCDFNTIRDPKTELNQTYRAVFTPTPQAQILGILNVFLPLWLVKRIPMKRNEDIEAASNVIRETCRKMIRLKKEKLEKNQLNDYDILSIALKSGGFTEENLVDQMMTFLAAGHETTSSALTWAVYLLCVNPSCQIRLREEIRANLPSPSSAETISSNQIDHLTYLNAVCNEVLRFYPPVALTMRTAAQETSLLGIQIPKGTNIVMAPWAVNKSRELWGPDVNEFKPDRWIPSEKNSYPANGGAASNYSFLTFLHGPRSCIGQGFAKAEFACLLAAWIGRFEFSINDPSEMIEKNLKIKGGVSTKPASGLYVRAKILDGW